MTNRSGKNKKLRKKLNYSGCMVLGMIIVEKKKKKLS